MLVAGPDCEAAEPVFMHPMLHGGPAGAFSIDAAPANNPKNLARKLSVVRCCLPALRSTADILLESSPFRCLPYSYFTAVVSD